MNDIVVLFQQTIQLFKGTNHEQVKLTSIQFQDPIDKMVEKEMAQLKVIKDEKEKEEMSKYKERIESVEKLHQVIDALETLNKKYVITKVAQQNETLPMGNRYYVNVWYVEEVDVIKKQSDGEEIVILVCKDCGISFRGKRNLLEGIEGMHCVCCYKNNTTIVPLKKECECK